MWIEPSSIAAQQKSIAAEEIAFFSDDDQALRTLLESATSAAVPSTLGSRRMFWQRYYDTEKRFRGPMALNGVTNRQLAVLDQPSYYTTTSSRLLLQMSSDFSVGIHYPVSSDDIEQALLLEDLVEWQKRREVEDRGIYTAQRKSESLAMSHPWTSATSLPAVSLNEWNKFSPSPNPVPALPADDQNSPIPSGMRVLRGSLSKRLSLDKSAKRRLEAAEEARRDVEEQPANSELPLQIQKLVTCLPTIEDLHTHEARYGVTSSTISAIKLIDKVEAGWLIDFVTRRPLNLEHRKR